MVLGLATQTAFASGSAEADLDRAVEATLAAPLVHVVQRTTAPRGPVSVEDFIAPDRLRTTTKSASDLALEGVVVGGSAYYRDSLAEPPANELYVECPGRTASGPQAFAFLEFLLDAVDVRRTSAASGRYRFELVVDEGPLKTLYDGALGTATIRDGRVVRFAFRSPERDGKQYRVTWSLRLDDVAPIEPPSPELVARSDCELTPGKDGREIDLGPA
jgi:hypothetical protein